MHSSTRAQLAAALGASILAVDPVGGGDINDAFRVRLDDGRTVTEIGDLLRALPADATTKAWLADLGVDVGAMRSTIERHLAGDRPATG